MLCQNLPQDLGLLGVVTHRRGSRSRQHEARVSRDRRAMIGECAHHSHRILEAVPARNLEDDSPTLRSTGLCEEARHLLIGQLSVLGRERVDAWSDDLHPRRVEPVRDVAVP